MATRSAETASAKGTGKRERILRAAIEVFARTGYFNSKVSEIAKEAGVADGTIYLYFLGKEDLLISIFREHMRAYLEAVGHVIAGESDPQARIRKVIHFHLETLGADRALAIVFQVELRQSLKFMSLFSHQEVADYLSILRRTIEEGQQQGLFRSTVQPHVTAKAVFGILDEMVTSWVLSEKDARLADAADPICDFVLNGLL